DRLGRGVDGVVRLLRRSREGAVDQMQLVPVVRTIDIVTDTSTVRKTEGLTSLLTHRDTGDRRGRTIARGERVRISEGLDGTVELLGRDQVQVLDVVRVLRVRLRTGRRLGDGRKTVPSVSCVVDTLRVGQVEDASVDAGLIETLADLVPNELGHDILLLMVKGVCVVIESFNDKVPRKSTQRSLIELL